MRAAVHHCLLAALSLGAALMTASATPPVGDFQAHPESGSAAIGAPLRKSLAQFGPDEARDVVLLKADDKQVVVLTNSDGSLKRLVAVNLGATPLSVAAADLDDDGDADLAVACAGPDVVKVLLNDGSGRMVIDSNRSLTLPGAPVRIIAQQLDEIVHAPSGDVPMGTQIDLAVGANLRLGDLTGAVLIYRNQGAARFVLAQTVVAAAGSSGTPIIEDLDSSDVDNDKDIDIVFTAASGRGSTIRLLSNPGSTGGWSLKEAGQFAVTADNGTVIPKRVRFAELNGDAGVDLLVTGPYASGGPPITLSALNRGGVGPGWQGFQPAERVAALDGAEVVPGALYSGSPWMSADVLALKSGGPYSLEAYANQSAGTPSRFMIQLKDFKQLSASPGAGASLVELNGAAGPELLLPTGYFRQP